MATTTASALPKSGAVSKGYNFASTWEQNAPLTEQQKSAIAALSQAVAERPFPANLVYMVLGLHVEDDEPFSILQRPEICVYDPI